MNKKVFLKDLALKEKPLNGVTSQIVGIKSCENKQMKKICLLDQSLGFRRAWLHTPALIVDPFGESSGSYGAGGVTGDGSQQNGLLVPDEQIVVDERWMDGCLLK